MKALTLIIGVVLLAVGVAGFLGMLPMDLTRSALFAITGAVGVMIGLAHRRPLTPTTTASDNDLRPWK